MIALAERIIKEDDEDAEERNYTIHEDAVTLAEYVRAVYNTRKKRKAKK